MTDRWMTANLRAALREAVAQKAWGGSQDDGAVVYLLDVNEAIDAVIPVRSEPRGEGLREAVLALDLECIRMHWGAKRPCDEYTDGRELCVPCKVRVLAATPPAPALDVERLGLNEEQTVILRDLLTSRQQTVTEWLGDVLMDMGLGRKTGRDYPAAMSVRIEHDHRKTCWCGHRWGVHASGGTQCLAVVDDPDRTALTPCQCQRWEPALAPERQETTPDV